MGDVTRLQYTKSSLDPTALARQIGDRRGFGQVDRLIDPINLTKAKEIALSSPDKSARDQALVTVRYDPDALIQIIRECKFDETASDAKTYLMVLLEHISDPNKLLVISTLGITDEDRTKIARRMIRLELKDPEMLRFVIFSATDKKTVENAILRLVGIEEFDVLAEIMTSAKFFAEHDEPNLYATVHTFTLSVLEANIDRIETEDALTTIANETDSINVRAIAAKKLADKIRMTDEIDLFACESIELLTCVALYHEHDEKWTRTIETLEIWSDTIIERAATELPADHRAVFCLACYSNDPEQRKRAYDILPEHYAEEIAIKSNHLDTATLALDTFDPKEHNSILQKISEQAALAEVRNTALERWFFTEDSL